MTAAGRIRGAALRHLTSELASRHFWGSAGLPPVEREHELSATVEALVAIGAISAEEGARWRTRLARAAAPRDEPDPALRARALEHLEALRARGDAVGAALSAFAGVGLITPAEADDWREPVPDEDDPPISVVGARMDVIGGGPSFDDSDFVRAVLGSDSRVAGMRVTVVELYRKGVVVHWHHSSTAGESPEADAVWSRLDHAEGEPDDDFGEDMEDDEWLGLGDPISLSDDLGTRYGSKSGSWGTLGGEGRAASGHDTFAPGVPPGARHLEVLVEGAVLRVDLEAE